MAEDGLCQIWALLVLDSDGQRLAVKFSSVAKKDLFPGVKQLAFEKRVVSKLPSPSASRSEVDVAVIDDYTVLFQACNDVVICAVVANSENELAVLQLVEGVYSSMSQIAQGSSFLSSGLTKQLVLDSLPDVLLVLDEVIDDGIIMEVDEEKITARVKMIDETEVTNAAQARCSGRDAGRAHLRECRLPPEAVGRKGVDRLFLGLRVDISGFPDASVRFQAPAARRRCDALSSDPRCASGPRSARPCEVPRGSCEAARRSDPTLAGGPMRGRALGPMRLGRRLDRSGRIRGAGSSIRGACGPVRVVRSEATAVRG